MSRPFDIVVHGATGFTGRQCATYLSERPGVRWAVSGRDLTRLERIKDELKSAKNPPGGALHADASSPPTCGAMAREARVVLSTAGPFAKLGDPIVDGCVAEGADYVDITGETPWARRVIDRLHEAALAKGLRLVPFSGFDSIPGDLGALLVVERLRERGESTETTRAWYSGKGGLNGGTLQSAIGIAEAGTRELHDPVLLSPPALRTDAERARAGDDPRGPTFDPVRGAWGAPFFMGPINSRVVRRSDALFGEVGRGYGPRFNYAELQDLGRWNGRATAALVSAGLAAADVGLRLRLGRALANKLGPAPGQGPSVETMDGGWFRTEVGGQGERGSVARAVIAGKGDPGNRSTVRMLCESALALVLDRARLDQLPHRGGVLTPATAFGRVLVDRLRAAGLSIDVRDA